MKCCYRSYATVSGWTWRRLIQQGRAALAVADVGSPATPADEVAPSQTYELIKLQPGNAPLTGRTSALSS